MSQGKRKRSKKRTAVPAEGVLAEPVSIRGQHLETPDLQKQDVRNWVHTLRQRAAPAELASVLSGFSPDANTLASNMTRDVHRTLTQLVEQSAAERVLVAQYLTLTDPDAKKELLAAQLGDVGDRMYHLDLDVVQERLALLRGRDILRIQIAVDILIGLVGKLPGLPSLRDSVAKFSAFDFEKLDVDVAEALLLFLARFCSSPQSDRSDVPKKIALVAKNFADDPFTHYRLQTASLELLFELDRPHALRLAHSRLSAPYAPGRDAFLVRRKCVTLLRRDLDVLTHTDVATDPSEHVRQEYLRVLARGGQHQLLVAHAKQEPSPRIKGFLILELAAIATGSTETYESYFGLAEELIDSDPLTARSVIESSRTEALRPQDFPRMRSLLLKAAIRPEAAVSRLALERLHSLRMTSETTALAERLDSALRALPEGDEIVLQERKENITEAVLGRQLATYGLSLRAKKGRMVLRKGERRYRRLWRTIFEIKSPRSDKRQGYLHTVGRRDPSEVVFPPMGMSEVTATKVPGERRYIGSFAGWGAFLPRIDDFLDVAEQAHDRELITPMGRVRITTPSTLKERLKARLYITRHYPELAQMRETALLATDASRRDYLRALEKLGFTTTFEHVREGTETPAEPVPQPRLADFFDRVAPFVLLGLPISSDYILSSKGNTPAELTVFTVTLVFILFLRATLLKRDMDRCRRSVALVIGGWGTRGKSGTERLKGGLFQGLGLHTYMKTTGCEAMIIDAIPRRKALEVFLYRPYDKPTIWEQMRVIWLAAESHAQVFLWECMALRPAYVDVLAHRWMKNDLTTLTNAYPDHEDVQGPSGEDVARVIGTYTPFKGLCFTAEEQMLPILLEEARWKKTEVRVVGALEADLLPADMLARFPYQEHPRNIALVLQLAAHLGIERERALIEMADNVVPDLGVLKIYPEAKQRGRTIYFSNGMSANERAGCLANWERLGLYTHKREDEWVMTTVNNRGDRVPRSRVFAKILVEDINASAHLCIGTNLNGLYHYVEEAMAEWMPEQRIVAPDTDLSTEEGRQSCVTSFDRYAHRLALALPTEETFRRWMFRVWSVLELDEATVNASASALDFDPLTLNDGMLAAVSAELCGKSSCEERIKADVAFWTTRLAERFRTHAETRKFVAESTNENATHEKFRQFHRGEFMKNVHLLLDSMASGDTVIDTACSIAPPGFRIHLIGVQNIKGTGLDFVYRWLSLGDVRTQLDILENPSAKKDEALQFLSTYSGYGVLDARTARDCVIALRGDPSRQHETSSEEWGRLEAHLRRVTTELEGKIGATDKGGKMKSFLSAIEGVLDPFDGIRRSMRARAIQEAFVSRRLSQSRAAELMREITSRDKGGWLVKAWNKRKNREKT